jgi:antitoxin VapB
MEPPMALNIKNAEVERLADQVARLTGESKTEAIRQALIARRESLTARASGLSRGRRLAMFLERRAWPLLPAARGRGRMAKAERERILGYGPEGV